LRDDGQLLGLAGLHTRHIGHFLHQVDAAVELAHGALHFGVTLVADHDEFVAFFVQLGHLDMHLGHQRAGGIKNAETASLGFALNGLAHAVRAEHQGGASRHVIERLNENRSARLEVVDHMGVVHDLVAHVNGSTKLFERPFDDVDGAVDPRTKPPGLGQQDFLHGHHQSTPTICTSNRTGWPAKGWLKSNRTAPSARTSRTAPA